MAERVHMVNTFQVRETLLKDLPESSGEEVIAIAMVLSSMIAAGLQNGSQQKGHWPYEL